MSGARVIVVDDQPDNRLLVQMVLSRAGYTVVEASLGAEALREIASEPPDVVICDVRLPDMDGIELLRSVKSTPALATIPVIILSADSSHAARERATAGHAYAYLSKPFEPAELLALLQACIADRG